MNKYLLLITIVSLLSAFNLKAQHPVYIQLTENDGLPDIRFYDIIEDNQGVIWLAADKGLFSYDGKKIKNYSHAKKRGLSVFGLKLDLEGKVWCNNISGQFFYVENNKLNLFKDFKEGVNGQLASFSFLKNKLLVSSETGLFEFDLGNLNQKTLSKNKSTPFYVKNDTVISFIEKQKSLHIGSNKKYFLSKYPNRISNKTSITSFKKKILFYNFNNSKNKTLVFYEDKNELKEIELFKKREKNVIIKLYVDDENIWLCSHNGVTLYQHKNGKFTYKKSYFENKAITSVLKDRNNNYWFTTLYSGIFIIPNIYIEEYPLRERRNNITAMSKIGKDSLMFGSTKGDIAILNKNSNKLKYLKNTDNVKVYSIFDNDGDVYLSMRGKTLKYNKKKQSIFIDDGFFSNAKDISKINRDSIVHAAHNSSRIINIQTKKQTLLNNKRAYTTYYDTKNKEIYVGYVDGVEKYDKNLNISKIQFNNRSIFAIDIDKTSNGIIWISTFKDGLIGIKNGKVIANYTVKNGLLSNQTRIIKGDGDLLWVSTNNSLQVLNTKTNKFKNLTKKDGISSFHISNIVIFNDVLFFSSNKGLFKLDKKKVFKNRKMLNFYFTSIFVDDKRVIEKKKYVLNSETKKIQFQFHTNGFLSEENIVYQYRLVDALKKDKWNEIDIGIGQVTFNNLSTGKYTFQLKAVDVNTNDETYIKSISLELKLPFYKEWWFVLSIFFIVLIFVWYWFTNRISKLRLRQKETLDKERMQKQLISSKLESLQSQMNPHFTFNALNSIQNLVLKGDKYKTYDYLTKFSLLIRENLNMSRKIFIQFEDELQLLIKYLELEKLRFREGFTYEINGEENIGDIKIPTMIIQPYIENALKHGLLHKESANKKVVIDFFQEDVLICTIRDNGIGVEASKKINKENNMVSESFSTNAIDDKLIFLREYYKIGIGVFYEDIAEGTKVTIKLPYT